MRYLLVVGFNCKVYRREPQARLFFNEKLIDEFYINHYLSYKSPTIHKLEPLVNKKKLYNSMFNNFRIYELEISNDIKNSSISIDIDNNDTDYSNGFMRRSTVIQLEMLALLPAEKKITKWFFKKFQEKMFSHRYPWYQKDRYRSFFLINSCNRVYNNLSWTGKNDQKLEGNKNRGISVSWIGGSGSFKCRLIKKYGLLQEYFENTDKENFLIKDNNFLDMIYDKYQQYENQRNTN